MSSYISHLTQLRCSNWNSSVSSYPEEITTSSNTAEELKSDTSVTNGIKSPLDYFPMFDVIEEGVNVWDVIVVIIECGMVKYSK